MNDHVKIVVGFPYGPTLRMETVMIFGTNEQHSKKMWKLTNCVADYIFPWQFSSGQPKSNPHYCVFLPIIVSIFLSKTSDLFQMSSVVGVI